MNNVRRHFHVKIILSDTSGLHIQLFEFIDNKLSLFPSLSDDSTYLMKIGAICISAICVISFISYRWPYFLECNFYLCYLNGFLKDSITRKSRSHSELIPCLFSSESKTFSLHLNNYNHYQIILKLIE